MGTPPFSVSLSLFLLVFALACARSSEESVAGAREALEEYFGQLSPEAGEAERAELITECARYNGLDGHVELVVEPPEGYEFDQAPGLEGRDRAVAAGTGRIAIEKLRQDRNRLLASQSEEPAPSSPEPTVTDAEAKILDTGPVLDPRTGESVDYGCRWWATFARERDPDLEEIRSLADRYDSWMVANVYEAAEHAAIELKQVTCLREAGYSGIQTLSDADVIVAEALQAWRESTITFEEALAIDKAVGLAYFDCYESVADEFRALEDRKTAEFLSQEGVDLQW